MTDVAFSLRPGQTKQLQALHQVPSGVGPPVNGVVVWTSDDETRATVAIGGGSMSAGSESSNATVTAIAPGDVTVTATMGDQSASFLIRIADPGGVGIAIVPVS